MSKEKTYHLSDMGKTFNDNFSCPNCGSESFEIVNIYDGGEKGDIYKLQCKNCKTNIYTD